MRWLDGITDSMDMSLCRLLDFVLEQGKAVRSSIPTWRIPWTVESMGSQRVGHD